MKKRKKSPKVIDSFTASNGYTIEFAPDASVTIPELTEEDFKRMRPARNVLPPRLLEAWEEMQEVNGRRGRPKSSNPKLEVKLRIDPDIVAAYRATGKGWQTRMNDALRDSLR